MESETSTREINASKTKRAKKKKKKKKKEKKEEWWAIKSLQGDENITILW